MAEAAPPAIIATWFVADDAADATFFPQVGSRSDAPKAQAVYWRCAVCFFASSMAVNPGLRHRFYTNTRLPVVDGVDIAALFAGWGVEVVTLPITWRLPPGTVSSWGNQFYVFDVISHHADSGDAGALVVLDSDCLWLRSAEDMIAAIAEQGALTYWIEEDEYPPGSVINGLTYADLGAFLSANGGPARAATPYFGGEIYAASAATNRALAERARALWPAVQAQGSCAPREEAHFLSVLYAMLGLKAGTANRFIRRMWTTFHFHNLRGSDRELTVWHLPAEKRTGFADLFRRIACDPAAPRLDYAAYALTMGYPRRRPRKFLRDIALKIIEKLGLT